MVNSHHQDVVNMNRKNLKRIIKGVLYLSKQGQAFRGHNETETSINRGNFMELVKLFSEDDVDLQKHLKNKTSNYTCHVISILT